MVVNVSGHGETSRLLSQPVHTVVTGPMSNKVFMISSSAPRGVTLTAATSRSTTAARPGASGLVTTEPQSSQSSMVKATASQKPRFSLRQLIDDGIIQPGYNVLSVNDPVLFCRQFSLKLPQGILSGPWKSLNVLEFKSCKFKALKVLEKSWNMISWFRKILVVEYCKAINSQW